MALKAISQFPVAFGVCLAVAAVGAAHAAPADLPELLRSIPLNLEGRHVDGERQVEVWGTLYDGTRFEAHYTPRGVDDIEVRGHHATLPLALVDRFVPGAARTYPQLSHITRLTQIDRSETGQVEVEGWTIDGRAVKAEFDRAGRLIGFEND
ncbi:hypothetical protein [Acuticoccus sp. I52.16.1]|uniref:hypothetical protein n=1 Tax=Acuticoccus sp. I52.16.1 TaxID=2928472 RepID=UPI001FD38E6C|nr:hypothetical protein [Acuticoccus sp. I52.16.1]UOM32726.1 hypothetical protein MRB58_12630 [Acuticoccus sp. I52.16.1]